MLTNEDIKNKYREKTSVYDRGQIIVDLLFGIREKRSSLVQHASGKVLEVGVGTGRNLQFYPQKCEITAIDYSPEMLEKARKRAREIKREISLQVMNAENLAFLENYFDTVVDTLCLCTYPNPLQALKEMRRVCKPKGRILLLEHGISSSYFVQNIQRAISPIVYKEIGCDMCRDHEKLAQEAGLSVISSHHSHLGTICSIIARP